jgi:uncharacterized cupredoxin-like copper-binding protein
VVGTALVGLLLSACGGGGDGDGDGATPPPAGQTLSVTASEFKFEPSQLTAPAGQDVTISLTNGGTVEHDLVIDEAGLKIHVQPGETATGTVNLQAGTYTFYCSIPGHREAGMEGTLTVS